MNTTRDKNGREIVVGDILKVFHFVGARNKRHFMYKQVIHECLLGGLGGSEKVPYLVVSHLNLTDETYYLGKTEGPLNDYEILQGLGDLEDRPKLDN